MVDQVRMSARLRRRDKTQTRRDVLSYCGVSMYVLSSCSVSMDVLSYCGISMYVLL